MSWQVRELLRQCLASLDRCGIRDRVATEVIVVDNASADRSAQMVEDEFPHVDVVSHTSNVGFGRANNLGLERAKGEYVLLLNPDTLVEGTAIDVLLSLIAADPTITVLGCRLLNVDGSLQRWTAGRLPTLWAVAGHYLWLNWCTELVGVSRSIYMSRDVGRDRDVGWVCGACMMLRRSELPTPLFDPTFFLYGEDVDLCSRVAQKGGRVVYTPLASVIHVQGASMRLHDGTAVSAHALRGMRAVYGRRAGPVRIALFDLITITGFALRYALFRAAGTVTGRSGLAARAASSRKYLLLSFRIALSGAAEGR